MNNNELREMSDEQLAADAPRRRSNICSGCECRLRPNDSMRRVSCGTIVAWWRSIKTVQRERELKTVAQAQS